MASTYSFDVVSDFDRQELVNTLDQVRRDVGNRYDLKDSGTEIDLEETEVVITTASDMTLQAVEDVLRAKATKRNQVRVTLTLKKRAASKVLSRKVLQARS